MANKSTGLARRLRHARLRENLRGTADRPRLCVYRSLQHIYCQVIDDDRGNTIASASTLEPEIANKTAGQKKTDQAEVIGKLIAERAMQAGIQEVVFDRGGFKYHGRVKSLDRSCQKSRIKVLIGWS